MCGFYPDRWESNLIFVSWDCFARRQLSGGDHHGLLRCRLVHKVIVGDDAHAPLVVARLGRLG